MRAARLDRRAPSRPTGALRSPRRSRRPRRGPTRSRTTLPLPLAPSARARATVTTPRRPRRLHLAASMARRHPPSDLYAARVPGAPGGHNPSTSHQYGPLPRRPGSARSVAPAGTECAHDPCTTGTAALARATGGARRDRADTDVTIVGIGRRGPSDPLAHRTDDPDVTRCLTSVAECRTDASRLGMGRPDAESICH